MPSQPERDAFLAERATGIGGSDAAAVLGLSPFKTPYQLWLEKTGQAPPEDLTDNQAVEWGTRLENTIAEAYAEKTGRRVSRVNRTLRHPEHPFIMAHLDRRVVGDKRGLEIKTAGFFATQSDEWGPSGSDRVPEAYGIQVQHYMAVTGWEAFDLAALIAGQDLRLYTIPRNERLIDALVKVEVHFWNANVQRLVPPSLTSLADARRAFPISRSLPIEASDEILAAVAEYRELKDVEKATKERLDAVQGQIAMFMGEADSLRHNNVEILTYRTQDRAGYTVKPSSARVMLLKKAKQ